jgi:hypothetical protein
MHAGFDTNHDMAYDQYDPGIFYLSTGAFGIYYGPAVKFTISGTTAPGHVDSTDFIELFLVWRSLSDQRLSADVTATLIQSYPVKLKFDVKVLTGEVNGIRIDNPDIHFYSEKTFLNYIDCCPGHNGLTGNFTGDYNIYLKPNTGPPVYLFTYTGDIYVSSRTRGYPIRGTIMRIDHLFNNYSLQWPDVALNCDYYFQMNNGYGINVVIDAQKTFTSVSIYDWFSSNFYRNDTLFLDYTFSGNLKTKDPVLLSKGVDMLLYQDFIMKATPRRQ